MNGQYEINCKNPISIDLNELDKEIEKFCKNKKEKNKKIKERSVSELSEFLSDIKNVNSDYLSLPEISKIEGITTGNIRKSLNRLGIKTSRVVDKTRGGKEVLIVHRENVCEYFNLKYGIH